MIQGSIKKITRCLAGVSAVICALWFAAGCSKDDNEKFLVSFGAGAGSATPPASYEVEKGKKVFLPGQEEMKAPERKVFDGWKDAADTTDKIYNKDEAYTVKSDVRFVAQWRADDKFKVSFGTGEGSGTQIASLEVEKGGVIYLPGQEEMKAPYWKVFGGWKDAADATGKIYGKEEAYTVNGDVRFVAQWETEIDGYSSALLPALPDLANKGALAYTGDTVILWNIAAKPVLNAVTGETVKDTVIEYSPYGQSGKFDNNNWVYDYYNEYVKEYSPCGEAECVLNGKTENYGMDNYDGKGPYRYKLDNNGNRIRFRTIIKERVDTAFVRDTLTFPRKTVTKDSLGVLLQALNAAVWGNDYTGNGTRSARSSRAVKDTWTTPQAWKDSIAGSAMAFNPLFDRLTAATTAAGITGRYSSYVLGERNSTEKQNVADTYYESIETGTATIQYVNFSKNSNLLPTAKARYKAGKEMFIGGALGAAFCNYRYEYADVKEVVNSGTNPNPTLVTTKKGNRGSVYEYKVNGTIQFSGAFAGTISYNNVHFKKTSRTVPEINSDYYYPSERYAYEYSGEIVIKSGTNEIKINLAIEDERWDEDVLEDLLFIFDPWEIVFDM